MTEQPQSWQTQEEALAALHAYAQQFASQAEDEEQYELFLSGHQIVEISPEQFVLALKPGHSPFTYA